MTWVFNILYLLILLLVFCILSYVLSEVSYRWHHRDRLEKFYKRCAKEWEADLNDAKSRFNCFEDYLNASAYNEFNKENFVNEYMKKTPRA